MSQEVSCLEPMCNSPFTFSSEQRNAFQKEQMAEGWENHFCKPSYIFHTKENKPQIIPIGDLNIGDLTASEKERDVQEG